MKRLKELFSNINKEKSYDHISARLKDLEMISAHKIDYAYIVYHIIGFKDTLIDRYIFKSRGLKKAYQRAIEIVKNSRALKPNHLEYKQSETHFIKSPNNIDYISFIAMMELNAVIGQGEVTTLSNLMSHIISIVCFSSNSESEIYDSNSYQFKSFQQQVLNQPLEEMLSLYNWIMKSLDESSVLWVDKFKEVAIVDEDYDQVGGAIKQAPYNVISTIKILCNDFNVTYQEAWQLSYAVTQTNSLAKATGNYVQDEMRIVMEDRMKRQRASRT
tara:strand:- start:145 stop:963 length:819 start_codon:yes stop_codon:yes gene_type:complete